MLSVWHWVLLLASGLVYLCWVGGRSMWRRFVSEGGRMPGIWMLIFGMGGLLMYNADARRAPGYFGQLLSDSCRLAVCLSDVPVGRARTYKVTAEVMGIVRGHVWQPARGKLLLYLAKDSSSGRLGYGDRLLLVNRVRALRGSGHPGGFDYAAYCARKGILYQAYLRGGDWCVIAGRSGGWYMDLLIRGRSYCISVLRRYVGAGAVSGVAEALLIGYREDLNTDLVKAYSHTGIMHIIAISGMHLALLYGALLWLMRWWPSHRGAGICKSVVVLVLLWGFALLTGAAASVLRAAVMFSFVTIGTFLMKREGNMANMLAASAFLLLCYDPYLLADAGFQLSYLAVLSILLLYRPIYGLLRCPNWWLDKLWDATALTFAAQVFTLPVCLYYFHQLPHLFLPANLVAVPLSTLVLYGEVVLLCLSGWPAAAQIVGHGIRWLLSLLNDIIFQLDRLPWSVTDHIHFPWYALVCLYLIICSLTAWWLLQWRRGGLLSPGILLLWIVMGWYSEWADRGTRRIVVYNIPGHSAIDLIKGREVWYAGDTSLVRQAALAERYIIPTRVYWHLPVLVGGQRWSGHMGKAISFGGKRMIIVDTVLPKARILRKLQTDYVLLSHNPKVSIKELSEFYAFKTVIFDASNSSWKIEQWKSDCYALTLRCFSVPDQGAFVINF
ncbi:hypothetical protein CK934_05935 [Chitinophaga sp. MD30]|nr:hypothetical protein CK934_05935 [Chitinophaga sp. MD30]